MPNCSCVKFYTYALFILKLNFFLQLKLVINREIMLHALLNTHTFWGDILLDIKQIDL
jgi:hypothetical protein